jgi:Uncharacterized protein conserved in bacteria (DUF2252)
MKEAQASVLEQFLGPSGFENHGERVVRGQRLMQAAATSSSAGCTSLREKAAYPATSTVVS